MSNIESTTNTNTEAQDVAASVAALGSRTLVKRRIEQAKARVAKAEAALAAEDRLIDLLNKRFEELPVEAGSLTANVGDKVTFKTGRTDSVRSETGVVQLVDGNKYKVLVGEGFDQTFKTIFAGQIVEVEGAVSEDATAIDGDELGL